MGTETHRPSAGSIQSKLVKSPLRLRVEPPFPSVAVLVGTVGSPVDVMSGVNAASKSSNSKMHLRDEASVNGAASHCFLGVNPL
jgi:hypothetical protein